MTSDVPLLTIGEFSRMTFLSVKTLRHYHETELLAPDQVDAHSGYRYYSTDQIPSAQIIRRFRDLDMPVRDIARLLAADVDERAALISDHHRERRSEHDHHLLRPRREHERPAGECSLCRGERPAGPAADDHLRLGPQPGDDLFDGRRTRIWRSKRCASTCSVSPAAPPATTSRGNACSPSASPNS